MRPLALALLVGLAPAALAQTPYRADGARLTVVLPEGFALAQALEEQLPDHGFYYFLDAEQCQGLGVAVHTYFSPEQRVAFGGQEWAERDLGHLDAVEAVDPTALPLPAWSAYEASIPDLAQKGLTLYGCDAARCYRVDVFGPAEGFAAEAEPYRSLLAGVRFDG